MRKQKKIKVYLADEHLLFRKGMIGLLQTFNRVGEIKEAGNGRELIKIIQDSVPDIVLLDMNMPVMDGIEACRFLECKYPKIKIIVLSIEENEKYADMMIGLGAHGFLNKNSCPSEVEKAMYAVIDHDFYHNEIVNRGLRAGAKDRNRISMKRANALLLTDREIEIIRLTCEEKTMKQISRELKISERTVHNHRAKIQTKIGVSNVAGLVKYAIQKEIFVLS
jgi:two-component system response regulator DegU